MNILRNQARACALILAALATSVNASTVSLNGPSSVLDGTSFQLTLDGDFSDVGLFAGGALLTYDNTLLRLDAITLNASLPADFTFSCPGASFCTSTANSETIGLNPTGFVLLDTGPAGIATLATLDFTALAVGTAAFSLVDDAAFGGWADLTGAQNIVTYSAPSVSINAIPVPAAVWLFGSGLLGLVGVARRRKAA